MARVTALQLREIARAAMLAGGGRGFVRFPEQGALLVCDALRRCGNEADRERLLGALAAAGFELCERDGLLYLTPEDGLFDQIDCAGVSGIDWESTYHPVRSLAGRWLKKKRTALTVAGRQLIIDALRLTWQDRVQDGLAALCAQAAVMQRNGDVSGFCQAGAVLENWCKTQEGKADED